VEDHLQSPAMCLVDETVEVVERPEHRVDADVIGDVVAEIRHRRGIDRRDPHGVDTEPAEVIEAGHDPRQVTDSVAVRILEGPRIHLIDDPALPPEITTGAALLLSPLIHLPPPRPLVRRLRAVAREAPLSRPQGASHRTSRPAAYRRRRIRDPHSTTRRPT